MFLNKKQVFLSRRVVAENRVFDGAVLVNDEGIIEAVVDRDEANTIIGNHDNIEVFDGGNLVLMAGTVDSHVHINEPGRTAWEGFRTATQAAAAGGITTLVDMPLNSIPPTTTVDNLRAKTSAAEGNIFVDVAFWGGIIPGNQDNLRELVSAGVVGFKCFLCPSGVEEFPNVDRKDLKEAIEALKGTDTVVAFHAELECGEMNIKTDPEEYSTYLASRPEQMEINAVNLIKEIIQDTDVRVHIVHVSSAAIIPLLEEVRLARLSCGEMWRGGVSAESCHHYLSLCAEDVRRGRTDYKCAPPIRDRTNQNKLWKCLLENKIDLVVSDHSPCTSDLKCSNTMEAWGGISSVQFGLSLFWTEASSRGVPLADVPKYLSVGPAKLCGLYNRKGALKPGLDADLVFFDPEQTYVITQDIIRHKNKHTPYLGKTLKGVVKRTYLRGQLIYSAGNIYGNAKGQLLLK